MKLIVLASGTSVPHPDRASSAHWVETSAGSVLLDISADAAHRMAQEQLDWPTLGAIWISHFHLAHVGGLATLLFGSNGAPIALTRTRPLRIFSPAGLERIVCLIDDFNRYSLFDQPFPTQIIVVPPASRF